MEAKILESVIPAKPKAGFFVLIGDQKLKIDEIEGTSVTLSDGSVISLEEASSKIIRYEAKINEKSFQVLYDDYHRISADQIHEGYVVERPRNAHEGDLIRVTNIDVIDEHELHNVKDRKGEIIRQLPGNRFNPEFEIQLETRNKLLKLTREKFTLLNEPNTKKFFHPRCTSCFS